MPQTGGFCGHCYVGKLLLLLLLLLVVVLQVVTSPVRADMVGRAAYRAGTELSPATTLDELADARAETRRLP